MTNNNLTLWQVFKKNKFSTLLPFLLLLSSYPYVFECFLPLPGFIQIYFAGMVLLLLFNPLLKSNKAIPKTVFYCMIFQLIVWAVFAGLHQDTSYLTRCFFIVLSFLILLRIHKTVTVRNFMYFNNYLIVLQTILGAIGFFLVLSGILHSLFDFTNIDGRPAECFGLMCSNARVDNVVRIAGYFDEPGALAYWGVWSLIINKLFFNNRKIEIILCIGLLFTLSLAYFIQLFVYFLLFYVKNIKNIILIICLALGSFTLLESSIGTENLGIINRLTVDRIDNARHGNTNRTELMELAKERFVSSPVIGIGATNFESQEYASDNPYEILGKDGIIGFIVTYFPLLIILLKFYSRQVFFGIIVLFLGYLQRPFHIQLIHYLILYSFMFLCIERKKNVSIK